MKRLYLIAVFILVASTGFAATKVDPLLNMMAKKPVASANTMKAFGVKTVAGVAKADVFIKFKSSAAVVRKIIEGANGSVRSVIGDILTASVPLDNIQALAANDVIIYIESSKPLRTKMDYARTLTGVDTVQDGSGITGGTAYTGSGVLVGVVDSGLDCEHADFKDSDGNPRIAAYWDQSYSGGSGVAEITSSEGTEYTGAALTDGTCANSPDTPESEGGFGHGTHVAGVAAGSDSTFKGVAYNANIIAVKYVEPDVRTEGYDGYATTLSSSIVDGVNYIFRKAQSLSKPVSVNLSIGTSLGAHDGTSLFEEALDNLLIDSTTSEDKVGRAIINAAGNENAATLASSPYAGGIHAGIDVLASSPEAFEFLTFSGSLIDPVGGADGTWVDIWLDSGSACTIQINAFANASSSSRSNKTTVAAQTTTVSAGDDEVTATDSAVTLSLDFTDNDNAQNGKQHAIGKVTATTSAAMAKYSFDLVFDGTCTGDAWLYFDNVNYNYFTKDRISPVLNATLGYTYIDGDSLSTMTIPATATKLIAVGSFMGRDNWTGGGSSSQEDTTKGTAGAISSFSSLGPTADGRTKPEIAAPGEPIISTLASNITSYTAGDSTHQKLEGTSMAAPHVTGTVALMLQKNKCLTPTQIRTKLIEQADGVANTTLPDNSWGYGKLDAAASVNSVTESDCVPDNPGDEGADDGTDDSGTSASVNCNLNSNSKDFMSVFVAFIAIFGLILARYGAKESKKSRSQ
jgi:subtilisin family serine protease